MRDIAHVGLVDAHAERNGGNEAERLLLEEGILVGGSIAGVHAGVVGQRTNPLLVQPLGRTVDLGAGEAIDDAGIAGVAGEEALQLAARVVALDDRIADIGPVEAGGEDARIGEAEPLDDIVPGGGVGGSGQRYARHAGIVGGDRGELAILGAKIVAPLADAVRLVDGDERDIDTLHHRLEAGKHKALRGDIEQVELAGLEVAEGAGGLFRRDRGVERRGVDASLSQRLDLVAHQRDERRDDDADALAGEGRDLEAHRLAGAGGEQHHRVATAGDVADNILLLAAETLVTEDGAQDFGGVARRRVEKRLKHWAIESEVGSPGQARRPRHKARGDWESLVIPVWRSRLSGALTARR